MSNQNTFRLIIETLIKVPTGALGVILDLLRRIIHKETGQQFTEDLKDWLRGAKELAPKPLIKWLGTTTTSATTEKFIAMDKFRGDSKEVKFSEIWDSFNELFLVGDGKIKEPIEQQVLRYGNLTKNSVDGPIIEELGGEEKAETTLTELYSLLKKQADGEKGVLLINGYANIFYIRDKNGVLRTVRADWDVGGWFVSAHSVEDSVEWDADDQVFSRNS